MTPVVGWASRLREPKNRRRLLTLTDQAASSLSNILIFLLVARSFDSTGTVGAFAAAMIGYQLSLGSTRSLIGQAFLSLYSHAEPEERARLVSDLHGASLTVGLVGASALVALSVALGGVVGSALLALAFVLPGLLLQDTWRFAFIVDRPASALILDLIWLAVVVAAFPLAPEGAGVAWFVFVWGAGGCLGAVVGWVLVGQMPGRPRPFWWFAAHRGVSGRYFGDFATGRVAHDVVAASVGAIAGISALGTVRAAQVYYGPHNTLHDGIYMSVVPEGARMRDQPEKLLRLLVRVSVTLAGLAGLWMVIGLLIPDSWGHLALGTTWDTVGGLLIPMGLGMMANAFLNGSIMGLRSFADAKRSLQARFRATPFELVCPIAGATVGGAFGFAVGFAVGRTASAIIWWRALGQSLRDHGLVTDRISAPESRPAPSGPAGVR